MKFYDIDKTLLEAINTGEKPVRVKIEIDVGNHYEAVFEQDILEANFYSLKEAAGGVSARAEVLLDNSIGVYNYKSVGAGSKVKVSFSIGEDLPFFQRFLFFLDDKGIQDIKGNGRKRFVRLGLRDLSSVLRKTDKARDWTTPAVFSYSVISDKSKPKKSLLHGIARRAGITANDIDCSTIPVTLTYVRLRRNIWTELSNMATAYRCHLECTVNKSLVFDHSPYQSETVTDNEYSYTFTGETIFYLRKIEKAELYRNSVRLKINLPVSLERQAIWNYDEPPVFYNETLQPYYPFRHPLVREIETGRYEAKYRITDENGKERNVVYADELDTKEEAEHRLEYIGGAFSYSHYDVTTSHDKARLTLTKENDGDLFKAEINGRPIVFDLNRSCFVTDSEAAAKYGTVAMNVTGAYFSDFMVTDKLSVTTRGIPQYEDWVNRELAGRLQKRREFTVKTHRALFHARVGAKVKIQTKSNQRFAEVMVGTINALSFRYKRHKAFVASFRIIEGDMYEGQ